MIDPATGLEVRTISGPTSDPDSNVLIDYLMGRGLVRDVGIWTDEEAERCRLAAFFPETAWTSQRPASIGRRWFDDNGVFAFTERFFSPFEEADHGLTVAQYDVGRRSVARELARGERLPHWCTASSEGLYGERREPLPWPLLVKFARARLEEQRAIAAARAKRKSKKRTAVAAPPSP